LRYFSLRPPASVVGGHTFFYASLSALFISFANPGARRRHNLSQKNYGGFITLYICNFEGSAQGTVSGEWVPECFLRNYRCKIYA